MATKRRSFNAQFKFKVALEAVKGVKTLSELASEHGVHPNQIGQWKQQLLKEGAEIFSHNSKTPAKRPGGGSRSVRADRKAQDGTGVAEKKSSLTNINLSIPLIRR